MYSVLGSESALVVDSTFGVDSLVAASPDCSGADGGSSAVGLSLLRHSSLLGGASICLIY